MNKNKLKSYAPIARREFIQVVTERAKVLGLSHDKIVPVEVKGEVAIIAGRPFPFDVTDRRKIIEAQIRLKGFEQVMEEVAYTWFNRFVALRFMELHDYLGHGFRVLSNPSGSDIPEILEKATSVDLTGLDKVRVAELRLAGDKDAELYKLLLVTQCNALYRAMPFLFEWVSDASELLLPENLLQTNSPLRKLVNEISEDDWQEIEIVGWLYQFYISEKKDQVIGKVVKSEDIPAATQLFTPNWIVKYMVQNTLGRKWMMTYPGSSIRGQMEFYIKPAEQEPEVQAQLDEITPKELNPEELTFMDPACGSGHILVEAYDLFKQIYLERGYRTKDIPRLILEKNLFGLDIDDRAAQLARFAVLMKARADDRRILDPENPVKLNILSIQESKGMDVDKIAEVLLKERVNEINTGKTQQQYLIQPKVSQAALSFVEKPEVSKDELFSLLDMFQDAKTFGALLNVNDNLKIALPKFNRLIAKAKNLDVQMQNVAMVLLPLVKQAELLAGKYGFVVANPPYMGNRFYTEKLKQFIESNYRQEKTDLYGAFIRSNGEMVNLGGYVGMITIPNWMFLSSFELLRSWVLENNTIDSLVHNGRGVWGSDFGSCSFVFMNRRIHGFKGSYKRLFDKQGSVSGNDELILRFFDSESHVVSSSDFNKIPGRPIAYWVNKKLIDSFEIMKRLGDVVDARQGMATMNNDKFLRIWHEVSINRVCFGARTREEAINSGSRWFPYNKGGGFRKWFGLNEFVVNWENDGKELVALATERYGSPSKRIVNASYFFQDSITWGAISSAFISLRKCDSGFLFDTKGQCIFSDDELTKISALAFLNSIITRDLLAFMAPTLDFNCGVIANLPFDKQRSLASAPIVESAVGLARADWDSFENSWNFMSLPLAGGEYHKTTLKAAYHRLRSHWREMSRDMQLLEEENNRIFIKIFGLYDELKPNVPLNRITLTSNPYFRYGLGKSDDEYETLLRADTMKEFISYAIGCMAGRYSLNEPGLIYANSGNQDFDSNCYKTFPADDDGIIPIMDDDWFPDDASNRFVEFLQAVWTPETLNENLKFVADSLDPKRGESPTETIRRFISTKFFKDHHLKVYKKRPIYWLFSSGKHKAFECLVYLHRYNEMTLARMRSAYVTPFQGKISARVEYLKKEVDAASSTSTRKQFQKELDTMTKKQQELREFDEKLRHYADLRISLDLDDGVKVNYGRFGDLLAEVKAVTGDKADGD